MKLLSYYFKRLFLFFLISLFSIFQMTVFAEASSIIGYWQTVNDETNQPEAIIQISKNNGKFFGKIVKLYEDPEAKCAACIGELHNQPLMNITVLSGFSYHQEKWSGGKILAVKKGKSYPGVISLSSNNNHMRLEVTAGFVSRTETWNRISAP